MAKSLSEHDKAVLNCVFNPSLPLEEAYTATCDQDLQDEDNDTSSKTQKIKQIEINAIQKAESGDLNEALIILNETIKEFPKRASLYNNRAQVHQLLNNSQQSFKDLSKAIQLAEEKQKRTLCQALCQRGLLYRKWGKTEEATIDFNEAAKLGSLFARNQLVELNPYAALCNRMLRKVVDQLK